MKKLNIVKYFLDRDILISPRDLESLPDEIDDNYFYNIIQNKVFGSNFKDLAPSFKKEEVFCEMENSSGVQEVALLQDRTQNIEEKHNVKIVFSYDKEVRKKEVKDFVGYFRSRYDTLRRILVTRQELQDSLSIVRISRKQEREAISIIGLVLDKSETKNGNIKLVLEDTTGVFPVVVTKTNEELYRLAKDVVLDEIIGVSGILGNNILFCRGIYFPDVPVTHELKKSPDEVYAVFISDIHFGIKNFLADDFMKFINWLRGEYGNEQQRNIASKVGYLFVTGDVVEGIGIYPGQEEDLDIKDIYAQYDEAVKYFKMVPENIKIIICGGNHDAMRMSEPQPAFDREISKGFYEISNMIVVSNPAVVNIHSSENFPGFDVLMYHGFSFPYYADNVPSITEKGGIFRCDLIMKYLLQKRHLAPSHSSTLYVPDGNYDPLMIIKVPDIFVSGHIHQITANSYRNITMINSSCWVVQSEDNAKRGIIPHPGKIPIINLQTREVRVMNFLDDGVKVLFNERLGLK